MELLSSGWSPDWVGLVIHAPYYLVLVVSGLACLAFLRPRTTAGGIVGALGFWGVAAIGLVYEVGYGLVAVVAYQGEQYWMLTGFSLVMDLLGAVALLMVVSAAFLGRAGRSA